MNEILDLIVIFLLVTAIFYGFLLNRKINLIKDSKRELAKLFKSFDDTILKAQQSVDELKHTTDMASNDLQKKIDRAILLIDDLSFVNEKAEKTSTQVLQTIESLKKLPSKAAKAKVNNTQTSLSPAEVKRLRSSNASTNIKPTMQPKKDDKHGRTEALEEILTQIAKQKKEPISNDNSHTSFSEQPTDTSNKNMAAALKALGFGKRKDS